MKSIEHIYSLIDRGIYPSSSVLVCKSGDEVGESVAKALLCENNIKGAACNICKPCKTFAAKSTPDAIFLGDEGAVKVDEIRDMKAKAYMMPVSSKRKVAYIKNADKMRAEAANALLKITEEPPTYFYVILQTEKPLSLLPTIRSRSTIYTLSEIVPEVSEETALCKEVIGALNDGDLYKLLTYSKQIGKNKAVFSACMENFANMAAQVLKGKLRDGNFEIELSSTKALRLAKCAYMYMGKEETNANLSLLSTAFLTEIITTDM